MSEKARELARRREYITSLRDKSFAMDKANVSRNPALKKAKLKALKLKLREKDRGSLQEAFTKSLEGLKKKPGKALKEKREVSVPHGN